MLSRTRKPKDVEFQRKQHYRAKQFRTQPTQAEQVLWRYLSGRHLQGLRFRRQFPIDRYIVDFCCLTKKLIVEVDGEIHEEQQVRDQNRTVILGYYGFTILRFTNDEVLHNIHRVLEAIEVALSSFSSKEKEAGR